MQEDEVTRAAQALVDRGVIAKVARPSSYRFGVRVPLGDGREALWDVDRSRPSWPPTTARPDPGRRGAAPALMRR